MRRILLLVSVLFAAIQLSAAPVDLASAQAKAQQFVQQNADRGMLRAPIVGEMKLVHIERNSKFGDRAVFYIFNSQNGYVMVAGDDRAEPILGYGDYPLNINTIPCNMRALFDMLKEQIEFLQAHEDFKVPAPSLNAPARIESVAPLLTALWDQEAPYWNQCKINGYQCYTGCPATSAAMVFHYWKYPDFETPEVPAYRCELSTGYYSTTYVNVDALPPVTFDWENMRDNYVSGYNSTQANAVATLMRYIGQAEHMAYGTSSAGGSGVDADSVSLIANAFKLFGYDEETVRVVKKTSAYSGGTTLYTDAEWAALMQEELAEGRPIVFCAISSGWFGGGHAFNVDGYNANTNRYHINFGWSGEGNDYYALNSFDGYNQYQQMVIGIQPPLTNPRLKSDVTSLSMECFKNQTASSQFKLTGRNLEGNVTLQLVDENNVFSIDHTTLTPNGDNKLTETINVTYSPKAEGEYTAKVIVSTSGVEDFEITLSGVSAYELYRPVMLDVDQESITATSFRADWSDATPAENVTSYTLEVKPKPDVNLLTEADWSNVPDDDNDHSADVANYLPEGWTFSGSRFYLDGGFISAPRNSLITANCDLAGYNKVSVIVRAMSYTQSSNTTLTVTVGDDSRTLMLAREVKNYLLVFDVSENTPVIFKCGNYPEIQSIKIYGGEIEDPEPFMFRAPLKVDEEDIHLIEGITPDKFYTVTGLQPATAYLYRVKAFYVNGTESSWSNIKEVVLKEQGDIVKGDINGDNMVNISDIIDLINYMTYLDETGINLEACDCNGDGEVNISDATALITFVLNGQWR